MLRSIRGGGLKRPSIFRNDPEPVSAAGSTPRIPGQAALPAHRKPPWRDFFLLKTGGHRPPGATTFLREQDRLTSSPLPSADLSIDRGSCAGRRESPPAHAAPVRYAAPRDPAPAAPRPRSPEGPAERAPQRDGPAATRSHGRSLARISHHGAPRWCFGSTRGTGGALRRPVRHRGPLRASVSGANKAFIAPEFRSKRMLVRPTRHTSTWNGPKRAPISDD